MNKLICLVFIVLVMSSFIIIDKNNNVELIETKYRCPDDEDVIQDNADSIVKLPVYVAAGKAEETMLNELTRRFTEMGDSGIYKIFIFNQRRTPYTQVLGTPDKEFSYRWLLRDIGKIKGVIIKNIAGYRIPILLTRYNTITTDSVIDNYFKETSDSISFVNHLRVETREEPVYQCTVTLKDTYLWWKIMDNDSIVLKRFVFEDKVITENKDY